MFAEQWHAEVVALVEVLVTEGKLDATDWSSALGAELDKRATEGAPDDDVTYYQAFLATLERLLASAEAVTKSDVDRRMEDWRRAYLNTPHGHPVVLEGAGQARNKSSG